MKKNGNQDFDVAMGSNDGAEICELVGIYLLYLISQKYPMNDTGLYRDDGLAIVRSNSGRQADQYRKTVTKIMKDNGLRVVVKCNLKIVDYLDITFNLGEGTYKPFKKPNNHPRYVHVESNHPKSILKQIPKSISKRISANSSNETIFNDAAPYYNERLKEAGYSESIKYEGTDEGTQGNYSQRTTTGDRHRMEMDPRNPQTNTTNTQQDPQTRNESAAPRGNRRRNRKRNVIYFNPPFCKSVKTEVGKVFLSLLDKHFNQNHRYHRIFNRNTVKMSYSCVDNMESLIKQHNRKISRCESASEEPTCDCRNPENCPLDGRCGTTNVNYSAEVTHTNGAGSQVSKTYIGLSEPAFKRRYTVHLHTFNNRGTPNDTSLSKYIWNLKDEGYTDFRIKWSIIKRARGYSKSSKTCGLCLSEKLLICEFPNKENLINDRSELVSKCRHFNKHLLRSCKLV